MTTGLYSRHGNAKLGKGAHAIGNINRMPGVTCPGATSWCASICYAKKGFYPFQYHRYANTLELPEHPTRYVRIHAAGDFDTVEYIAEITSYVESHPETKFWAYTRSWSIPELLSSLEILRALPNMQLFASVDQSTIGKPPSEWRVAYVSGTPGESGPVCMEMTGAKQDCFSCGYCFKGRRGNVIFKVH
jgi:hypothetical protein